MSLPPPLAWRYQAQGSFILVNMQKGIVDLDFLKHLLDTGLLLYLSFYYVLETKPAKLLLF